MQNTKKKIIETTILLFNRRGFANVSLPQIAGFLNISLGNLTYHFPKKDQLIEQIYQTFQSELALITRDYEVLVDLGEMDKQVRNFYTFQQRFQFFYLDLLELERAYPAIAELHYQHTEDQINGIYKDLLYNAGLGNLQGQISEPVYMQLAHHFWMCVAFWPMQLAVRGKTATIEEMSAAAWSLIHPYTTEKGKDEFQNIFKTEKIV